jgi:hypothetical protein
LAVGCYTLRRNCRGVGIICFIYRYVFLVVSFLLRPLILCRYPYSSISSSSGLSTAGSQDLRAQGVASQRRKRYSRWDAQDEGIAREVSNAAKMSLRGRPSTRHPPDNFRSSNWLGSDVSGVRYAIVLASSCICLNIFCLTQDFSCDRNDDLEYGGKIKIEYR